ncbi:MAG: response regulator transcription factor [Polyangiaceae bacterium]|nr:response regulator transcription factor [Polyangiaceae bacterium]
MPSVLLIEDDEALGRQLVDHLKREGYSTVWWKKGRLPTAEDLADVTLIVLDLMLPEIPGLDVLAHVREISEVPVLVLSARQDSSDKVRALKLGADDYVTKPFWPEELLERLRARLRRPTLQRDSTLRWGALEIDTEAREARMAGRRLELTKVELDLLVALVRKAGKPLSRAWLLAHVLDPDREATERTLDVHVSRLRKKLGDPSMIETVWGAGYRMREADL